MVTLSNLMPLTTIITFLGTSFLFLYLSLKSKNKPLKFLFLFMSMLFIYLSVSSLYSASLSPETRLNSTIETTIGNTTNTTFLYEEVNQTWIFAPTRASVSIIQYILMFLMFYFIVFFLISVISFVHEEVTGKKAWEGNEQDY